MLFEKIKKMCEDRGISVRSVEASANLSNGSISKWNEATPKADRLIAVAKVLGVTAEELMEENAEVGDGG